MLDAIGGAIRIFALAGLQALTSLQGVAFLVFLVAVGLAVAAGIIFRGRRKR